MINAVQDSFRAQSSYELEQTLDFSTACYHFKVNKCHRLDLSSHIKVYTCFACTHSVLLLLNCCAREMLAVKIFGIHFSLLCIMLYQAPQQVISNL